LPIDPNIAAYRDETTGSPALGAMNYAAIEYDQTGVSKSPNQGLDVVDVGAGLTLVSGDGADPDGVFADFLAFDEGTVNNRFGYISSIEGVLFIFGMMMIGNATATVFNDSNQTIVFPDGLFAEGFSGLTPDLQNASTVIDWKDISFFGKGSVTDEETRPVLLVLGTNGIFTADGCVFDAFSKITLTSAATLLAGVISNCLALIQAGGTVDGAKISGATTADGVALILCDDLTKIKNCEFTFSDGHALELTAAHPASPTELNLDGCKFTGYGTGNDAAIYNNSVKALIINIIGGGDTPTIRNGGGASTTVNNPVTHKLTGMAQNSEVTYIRESDEVEVFHVEDVDGTGITNYNYEYTGDVVVRIQIHHLDKVHEEFTGVTLGNSNASIPIKQRDDRVYSNP